MVQVINSSNARLLCPRSLKVLIVLGFLLMLALGGCANGGATPQGSLPGHSLASSMSSYTEPRRITPTLRSPAGTPIGAKSCAPAEVTVAVSPARPTYASGDPVLLTVSALNDSESPCSLATGTCIPQVRITDESGADVWNRAATQVLCSFGKPQLLGRGHAISQKVQWNGRRCPSRTPTNCQNSTNSPGIYRVTASWQSKNEASTSFKIAS